MSLSFSEIAKFFTMEKVLILLAVIAVVVYLLHVNDYSLMKSTEVSNMEDGQGQGPQQEVPQEPTTVSSNSLNPQDLLPKDANANHPVLNELNNNVPDVLPVGHHLGAVSQSLRNANLQLRSDPEITKVDVGPWNQSTIEADLGRVPLELGCVDR